jgi:hypothetical protein
MKTAAPNATIDYSTTGTFANTSADYSVVVIGETPYAEGAGDRTDLSISPTDVSLIKKMKSYGAPVIVILVSGRPLILEKILHFSDVIIAAWLPGTEGNGVADVLFGDYQPRGVLSHTWPKNMSQIPINYGDSNYSPLFQYGFGNDTLADSPVGSPPVCLSAIITSDAKHFELTFNKRMKDPSSAPATFILTRNRLPFIVASNPILNQNDSTTIIVKIDSTDYSPQDTATISYSSGFIQSVDGGILQPFAPIDACNWMSSSSVAHGNNLIPFVNTLDQNFPNPFNPTTLITYHVVTRGYVTLKIFDVLGREITTLVEGENAAGIHSITWDASRYPSGIYFYRLTAERFIDVKKMVLLK